MTGEARPRRVARWVLVAAILASAPPAGALIAKGREARGSVSPNDDSRPAGALDPTSEAPELVGVLLPSRMANLSPRTEGRILEVRVKLGQAVRAGDAIVLFDARERQHELAMARAQLAAARAEAVGSRAELAAARKRVTRRSATVDVGGGQIPVVSGEEAAQAHADADGAAARSAAARAKIAEQQARFEQLRVAFEEAALRAPFDGVVTALNFEPGTTVHAGEAVARVVGGAGLRARIAVPEEVAGLVHRTRARVEVDGQVLFANVDQVGGEVEPASRAFVLEGTVELRGDAGPSDSTLLAGRAVRAWLLEPGK
jgi:HlyD family secretion protein